MCPERVAFVALTYIEQLNELESFVKLPYLAKAVRTNPVFRKRFFSIIQSGDRVRI